MTVVNTIQSAVNPLLTGVTAAQALAHASLHPAASCIVSILQVMRRAHGVDE